jgi:hypothetical protein
MKNVLPAILIALFVLASTPIALAEEPDDAHHDDSAGHAADHHAGREHMNEVAIFLGMTDEKGHDNEFTWGLDYKRRLAERWAVGGLVDFAGGELRNAIVAASVSYWPGLGNLQLLAAPGVEFHEGRGGGANDPGCGCGKSEDTGHLAVPQVTLCWNVKRRSRANVPLASLPERAIGRLPFRGSIKMLVWLRGNSSRPA